MAMFMQRADVAKCQADGVWIARYIGYADFDLAHAIALCNKEQDRSIQVNDWIMVHNDPSNATIDSVLIRSASVYSGENLVIFGDLSVEWVSHDELRTDR